MTVSVIIPAFNCSQTLENTVKSLLESGLDAFEVLIINDGSSDHTEEAALRLQNRYPNVRVISQPNRGVSATRNRGIREAKGDYLYFVDADDSLVSGTLADVNMILNGEQPDMLLFGLSFDYYKHNERYRSDVLVYPTKGIMAPTEWGSAYADLFAKNMLSPVWNKLIRRDLIRGHDLAFREDMIEMEDYLFSAECLLFCDRIYLMDKVVYRYRQAENERATFNRLWRIHSLSEYIQPFYEIAEALEGRFSKLDIACCAKKVSDRIYSTLFYEQLRFASISQIAQAAGDMFSGRYASVIEQRNPNLYQNLKKKKYVRVWLRRVYSRARHFAAVQVKYRNRARNQR